MLSGKSYCGREGGREKELPFYRSRLRNNRRGDPRNSTRAPKNRRKFKAVREHACAVPHLGIGSNSTHDTIWGARARASDEDTRKHKSTLFSGPHRSMIYVARA